MARVVFEKGELDQYLSLCKEKMDMSLPQLAQIISVERHTLNDWRRGKRLPNLEKLTQLSSLTNVPLPKMLSEKPEHWASSAAAIHRHELYGCNLTHADRVKAGTNSQQRRREYPEYYASLGCNVAHSFALPINRSNELAELVGILLGDGGIRPSQFTIILNAVEDKQYSMYVIELIYKLFFYKPSSAIRKGTKTLTLTSSGTELIKYLLAQGLHIGNKVKQQVDVPSWIKENGEYSRWCLRGLMDTDGGIFAHSYVINHKAYSYLKTHFTNASMPLLSFVHKTLKDNGFHPKNKQYRKVWLYSQVESKRYLELIGSSNERLLKQIRCYNHQRGDVA